MQLNYQDHRTRAPPASARAARAPLPSPRTWPHTGQEQRTRHQPGGLPVGHGADWKLPAHSTAQGRPTTPTRGGDKFFPIRRLCYLVLTSSLPLTKLENQILSWGFPSHAACKVTSLPYVTNKAEGTDAMPCETLTPSQATETRKRNRDPHIPREQPQATCTNCRATPLACREAKTQPPGSKATHPICHEEFPHSHTVYERQKRKIGMFKLYFQQRNIVINVFLKGLL